MCMKSVGIPAIALNVDGIPEIVEDDVNGFLFPIESSTDTIADKVLHYANIDHTTYHFFCCWALQKCEISFHNIMHYKAFYLRN